MRRLVVLVMVAILFLAHGTGAEARRGTPRRPKPQQSKDYYKILGIKRGANDKEIKNAYREMAKKYHPDRVADDKKEKATAKFHDIGKAYETLSDPEKRRIYDQVGEAGLENNGRGGGGGGGGGGGFGGFGGGGGGFGGGGFGGGGFGAGGQRRPRQGTGGAGFNFGGGDFSGMFNNMFGGGAGGRGGAGARKPPPPKPLFDKTNVLQMRGGQVNKHLAAANLKQRLWVVLFFKGRSEKLKSLFTKLADRYRHAVRVGAVDCGEKENAKACAHFGKDKSSGRTLRHPFAKLLWKKSSKTFSGKDLSAKSLVAAVDAAMGKTITKLSSPDQIAGFAQECVEAGMRGCVVLLSESKPEPSSLYASVAAENMAHLHFAYWYADSREASLKAHDALRGNAEPSAELEDAPPLLYQFRTGDLLGATEIKDLKFEVEKAKSDLQALRQYAKIINDAYFIERSAARRKTLKKKASSEAEEKDEL